MTNPLQVRPPHRQLTTTCFENLQWSEDLTLSQELLEVIKFDCLAHLPPRDSSRRIAGIGLEVVRFLLEKFSASGVVAVSRSQPQDLLDLAKKHEKRLILHQGDIAQDAINEVSVLADQGHPAKVDVRIPTASRSYCSQVFWSS